MLNLVLALTMNSFAEPVEYEKLNDQDFTCNSDNFSINQEQPLRIDYEYCSQGLIDFLFIKEQIVISSNKIFNFAKSLNMTIKECAVNRRLEIYSVPMKVLNDTTRFNKTKLGSESNLIWGLYDPRIEEQVISSLILTDHGKQWNEITFAHELSHYWYDRLCLNKQWSKTDEQFALDFEIYLEK